MAPYLTADVEVSWSLAPADFEDLEVVVTAQDTGHNEDYDKWLPRGQLQDWHQPGSLLNLVAVLRKTNGAPTTFTANQFIFELSEVSHESGVCMNRPIKQFANTDPDLKFDELFNLPPFVPTPVLVRSAFRAETVPFPVPSTRGEVILSCYDFGAYGVLRVTADVGGLQIPGYIKNDPAKKTKILLPKRKEDSHIADFWKEDKGVDDLPDTDDQENDPEGDKHQGDGLTLYEEYRGFSENLKHVRANPKKKDLFIADTINNWRSKNGIALFAWQTGLKVHHQLQPAELSSRADLTDRWINFNTNNDTPHVVDQHGLLLEVSPKDLSEAVPIDEFSGKISTPGSREIIFIYRFITAPSTAPSSRKNIDGINEVTRNGTNIIITDNAQSTTAHELAHGCSVWHHGECDKKLEWRISLKLGDRTPPPYIASEQGGLNIVLKQEPNVVMSSIPFIGTREIWLGMPQGQHSGVEDCIMRYDIARAYPQRNSLDVRFWVKGDEMTGLFFCTTATGTGVNLAGRVPQSRYGDAANAGAPNGRGNCKGQICVNDLYLRHALHDRTVICP